MLVQNKHSISSFIIGCFILCGTVLTYAQQDPMYSLYAINKALINPAYVGSSNFIVSNLSYRTQMVGLPGAPITDYFNLHAPIQKKHLGVGIKVVNDQTGPIKTLTATGTISYHLGFAGGKLSFGLEGGMVNRSVDFSKLISHDPNDPLALNTVAAVTVPDLNFGFWYQRKQFYFGFSDYNMTQSHLDYTPKSQAQEYSNQYFLLGWIWDLGGKWDLEPSTLYKHVAGAPSQFDINCYLNFDQKFGVGGSYRTGDGVYFLAKYSITPSIRLAYSYDYALSPLSTFAAGSHEIMLSYRIKLLPPPEEKEIHPRYYF